MDLKLIKKTLDAISPVSLQTAEALVAATQIKTFEKGAIIEATGQIIKHQYIVVNGIVRKYLTNPNGEEFTVDFFTAYQVITPALIRSVDFVSFVNLEVISAQASVMLFSNKEMEATMQNNIDLEQFGFKVMMHDAYKRAEREKILLTATGIEKLNWFRKNYPHLENEIPHYYIASFLGMTPTSLSRLRKQKT